MNRFGVVLFSSTLLTSAFLLFSIQPFVAKSLLPSLGGTPMVWNTCVVFFQALVLAGYGTAHLIAPRRAAIAPAWIYIILLTGGVALLPVAFDAPPATESPVIWLFAELTRVAGLPVFALAITAPLLQACYAQTDLPRAKDPYFLYGASNAGSFAALFTYPALIEPSLRLSVQSRWWTVAYGLCALLAVGCVAMTMVRRRPLAEHHTARPPIAASQRLRWVALAFIPSSLMLGVTTYISTDIAAVPLLWVLPLGIYLATFIVAFRPRFTVQAAERIQARMPFVIIAITFLASATFVLPLYWNIPIHLLAFGYLALVCHGRLAADRPPANRLTEFYFLVSVGGVAGGAFNTLIAPLVFDRVAEYPLMLVAASGVPLLFGVKTQLRHTLVNVGYAALIAIAAGGVAFAFDTVEALPLQVLPTLLGLLGIVVYSQARNPLRFTLMLGALVYASFVWNSPFQNVLHSERTFFGSYHVTRSTSGQFHTLIHGTTVHGRQALDPAQRQTPLTYYHPLGPAGQAFMRLESLQRASKIAAVGLGVGSLSAYAREGQQWTFFEIDPVVERIASDPRYFTFLSECGSRCRVAIGDARLSLQRGEERFDAIVLDAFSSDSIPVHLVTLEALDLYLARLNPGGVLLFHVSNRYLALDGVIATLAASRNLAAARQLHRVGADLEAKGLTPSEWIVVSANADLIRQLTTEPEWTVLNATAGSDPWTDDYSNILGVLKPQ